MKYTLEKGLNGLIFHSLGRISPSVMRILALLVWFDSFWIVSSAAALPNIILMLADDLGNYEVGFHNPRAITPHIDVLAHTGVRLERHYVYHMCGPTRSATMTGRLPFHNNQHNVNDLNSTSGVDLRMTMLPAKLKQAGYATSMIGKSHLGARSVAHLPINRGFDQHFGFLGGGEDHYTQVSGEDPVVGKLVDLWRDHGPAYGENGTFSGYLYSAEAERVITQVSSVEEDHSYSVC